MQSGRAVAAVWLGLGILAAAGVLGLNLGAPDSWRDFGVPAIDRQWSDVRIITSGAECDERGLDPLVKNPCDHAHRALNYPRVWVTLANVLDRSVVTFATIFSIAYLLGVTVVFRRLRPNGLALIVFALAIFGPPALLALERGNNDLLVVGMVAIGVCLVVRRAAPQFVAGALVLALAAFLKLFPVVALPVVFLSAYGDEDPGRRRRHLGIAGAATLLVLVAFAVQSSDIQAIFDHTSRPGVYAYGYGAVEEFVRLRGFGALFGDGAWYYLVLVVALLLVPLLAFASRRPRLRARLVRPALEAISRSEPATLFVAGVLVFAVTLVLDSYPYKLTVLVLALPLCVHVLQNRSGRHARSEQALAVGLVALIGALWVIVSLQLSLNGKGEGFAGAPTPALGLSVALAFVLCVAILVVSIALACLVWRGLETEKEAAAVDAQ